MKEKLKKFIFELNYRFNEGHPTSNKKFVLDLLKETVGALSIALLFYVLFCLSCFI